MAGDFRDALHRLQQIPASDVKDIQILRGPVAAFLQGSADGAIFIRTRSGPDE
jgi:outer membrane receptor protein involved in Fe transport